MTLYEDTRRRLERSPKRWLVTGAAGFIGSHLVERLLDLGQRVVGLDNFSTGRRSTAEALIRKAPQSFLFIEADIADSAATWRALSGTDYVLHQAALGSVPRSMERPLETHASNVDGFVRLLSAARDAGVQRFVYASSSSVYGDDASTHKSEGRIGSPLSPYAASKRIDEVYAEAFDKAYGFRSVGLRYFNVFGPRQDPAGPYAAVVPRWTDHLLRDEPCVLYGDGDKSRDFCFVDNVVQANVLAATVPSASLDEHRVFNIAFGARTSLEELFAMIRDRVAMEHPQAASATLMRQPPRPGDIAHSLADISVASRVLGYEPTHDVARGLDETISWACRTESRGQFGRTLQALAG
jgi:UDP-N-acetylglucosamine 4-epimerase